MMSQRLPDTEFEIMEYIWRIKPPVTTSMVIAGNRDGKELEDSNSRIFVCQANGAWFPAH